MKTSDESKFYFMLPRLVDLELCVDDGDEYSLVTYPREVISQAAIVAVADYAKRMDAIPVDKKKRVKMLMENLAVALTLKVEHAALMDTARVIYKKWFEDPSMFGDLKRQNKYLKRMVKQLSAPFAIRGPEDRELFMTEFNALLNNILCDLKYVALHLGKILEKDTWELLLNVSLGITDALIEYDFAKWLSKADAAKLRQRSIDVCFTVMEVCGLTDDYLWDRWKNFCGKWSDCFDFVRVWGGRVKSMFLFTNTRVYKMECDPGLDYFQEGVYSAEAPISDKMVKFIFTKELGLPDSQKFSSCPENLRELSQTLSEIALNLPNLSGKKGRFVVKYPASVYLKLFGGLLTGVPSLADTYDEAMSIIVDTALWIIANLETDLVKIAPRLIGFVTKRADPTTHMQVAAAFLNRAGQLFRYKFDALPYIADRTMTVLPMLAVTRAARLITDSFWMNTLSLFASSAEMMAHCEKYRELLAMSFDMIWKTTTLLPIKFKLLCIAKVIGIRIADKLETIFSEGGLRHLCSEPMGIDFVSSILLVLGVNCRFYPDFLNELNDLNIIKLVLESVMKLDAQRIEGFDVLLQSVFQMLYSTMSYRDVFLHTKNMEAILWFLSETRSIVGQYKGQVIESAYVPAIVSLYDQLWARISLKLPPKDLFSRRLNSNWDVSENTMITLHELNDPSVHYFSIGPHLLLSVMCTMKLDDPLYILLRGPHGKSMFTVNDVTDFEGGLGKAKLASGIGDKEDLPEMPSEPVGAPTDLAFVAPVSEGEFTKLQDQVANKYQSEYKTWYGNKYDCLTPFAQLTPYHRPRVVDFLSRLGLLSKSNVNEVRMISNMDLLQEAVNKFDVYDTLPLLPVCLHIVLPKSKNGNFGEIEYVEGETDKLMTPLVHKFLREIGEPFSVPEDVGILPPLRTTVPMIPALQSVIAVLCPAMAETAEGAKTLYEIGQTSTVKILFNETNFELDIEPEERPKQLILSIRPTFDGLYHVRQHQVPKHIYSPFADEQTMSANTLAMFIAICFEENVRSTAERTLPNLAKLRKDALSILAVNPCDPAIGGRIVIESL